MNWLDLVILAIVALCALAGFRQGLIRTVYRLASFFIAIFLSNMLYPYAARALRGTPLFYTIQNSVSAGMNLEGFVVEYTADQHTALIDALPLPATLRNLLHNSYSPEMFSFLRVDTIEDYISGFFANMAINAIAIVGVFILVMILLSIVGVALDIVGHLPVIRTFNRAGGLIAGLGMGALMVWLSLAAMSFLFAAGANPEVYELMRGSLIAGWVMNSMIPQLTNI